MKPQSQDLTAIYPGTFDPMTLGHEDLMRRAAKLFSRLQVDFIGRLTAVEIFRLQ